MPTSKKPRKKYVPGAAAKKARFNGEKKLPLTVNGDHVKLSASTHSAMLALAQGRGTPKDWADVAAALNVALILSETVFEFGYHDELQAATLAHAHCAKRHRTTGRYTYTGQEIKTINFALDVADVQLSEITFGEFNAAMEGVSRRIAEGSVFTPDTLDQKIAQLEQSKACKS